MPTPHTFSSTRGASHGRPEGATTRAAVNAIFQSSEALRRQAREELYAAAQERRRIAHDQIVKLRRQVRAKERAADKEVKRLHSERMECTREVQSQLHEFRNNLHAMVTEHLGQLAAARKRGTRSLVRQLTRTRRKETAECQEHIRVLTAERMRDTEEMRKNLAEFMDSLHEENAARRQRVREELGWNEEIRRKRARPSRPSSRVQARREAPHPEDEDHLEGMSASPRNSNGKAKAAKQAAPVRAAGKKPAPARKRSVKEA